MQSPTTPAWETRIAQQLREEPHHSSLKLGQWKDVSIFHPGCKKEQTLPWGSEPGPQIQWKPESNSTQAQTPRKSSQTHPNTKKFCMTSLLVQKWAPVVSSQRLNESLRLWHTGHCSPTSALTSNRLSPPHIPSFQAQIPTRWSLWMEKKIDYSGYQDETCTSWELKFSPHHHQQSLDPGIPLTGASPWSCKTQKWPILSIVLVARSVPLSEIMV